MTCYAIDTSLNAADDVLDNAVESCIIRLLLEGRICFVWLGMPCTTFSLARKDDGTGPGPLRSDEHPMGLEGLSRHDQRKLNEGNLLL